MTANEIAAFAKNAANTSAFQVGEWVEKGTFYVFEDQGLWDILPNDVIEKEPYLMHVRLAKDNVVSPETLARALLQTKIVVRRLERGLLTPLYRAILVDYSSAEWDTPEEAIEWTLNKFLGKTPA